MFSQFESVDPESDHHWNEKVNNWLKEFQVQNWSSYFYWQLQISSFLANLKKSAGEKSLDTLWQKWGWKTNASGIQVHLFGACQERSNFFWKWWIESLLSEGGPRLNDKIAQNDLKRRFANFAKMWSWMKFTFSGGWPVRACSLRSRLTWYSRSLT